MVRRSGVRNFKLDMETGLSSFLLATGQPIDFAEIQRAVKESGFELLRLEARVRGTLNRAPDPTGTARPTVRVEETGQVFVLVEGTTDEERQRYARLLEWLDDERGPKVVVRGRIHPHVGAPPGLSVLEFRVEE